MDQAIHPLASHDLPSFITAPGETDVLLAVTAAILIFAVIAVGVLYFNLHSLPERMSHKTNRFRLKSWRFSACSRCSRITTFSGSSRCFWPLSGFPTSKRRFT